MKIVLSILSCIFVLNASGNSSLSLSDALKTLKRNNIEIKTANINIKIADENLQAAEGVNWGKLSFTQDIVNSNDAGNVFGFKLTSREANFGDFGFSEFSTTNPNILTLQPNDLNYPKTRSFFQSKLKYELPLFTGFAISNYTKILTEVKKIKKLQKEEMLNEKIYQLKKSYYDMALLNNSIKHLQIILQNINTLQNITKNMIIEGYAKHIDLLEVKSKKGNVERLLQQMQSNKKLLYHYLSFLLNEKVTQIETPKKPISLPIYSDETILKNNLDIKKASTGLSINESMLKASKSVYYPTIGAFAELSTADNTFLGDADKHKSYTVGAHLSWNLFNGGIDTAKIEKSKLQHLKMRLQVELAKNGIKLKIAKIKTEIQSADEEIRSLQAELKFADAIYKNYEGRYKEKLSSMSDVIIKQSAQIQKILELQVAQNKRNEKIFALEKLANGEN